MHPTILSAVTIDTLLFSWSHGVPGRTLVSGFVEWVQGTGWREKSHAVFLFRYFVLDFEAGLLQYFVNEQNKQQKPRGVLSLSGAIVSLSDEAPHMLVVYSANGEMYKLRGTFLLWRQCEGLTMASQCCTDWQLFCGEVPLELERWLTGYRLLLPS